VATLPPDSAVGGAGGVASGAGSRRGSSYVPEKLSFAAYEKFEGKFAQIFVFKYSKVQRWAWKKSH